MIDLHCHILPGLDDGAPDIEVSIEMARMAVADGISATACTPHILPGVWNNTGPAIRAAIEQLDQVLIEERVPLVLLTGADVHIAPDLVPRLHAGEVLSLNESRYFLLEPPHHVAPPRLEDFAFKLMAAGFMPILTHPERLSWIDTHYPVIERLAAAGVWMQLTAASITGRFGRAPRYWSDRMLDEGIVHIIATDAHDTVRRPPLLAEARDRVAERLGEAEAEEMVLTRPMGVLKNAPSSELTSAAPLPAEPAGQGRWRAYR